MKGIPFYYYMPLRRHLLNGSGGAAWSVFAGCAEMIPITDSKAVICDPRMSSFQQIQAVRLSAQALRHPG